jgi:chromate transporter
MRDEVVVRRGWLTDTEFLDLLGATNMIPGPNSTQMAIHIGYRRAGWAGLIMTGVCFIAPAAAIVLLCAWAYKRYGGLPQAQAVLYGVKPVIIAIVAYSLRGLIPTAARNGLLILLGAAALVAALLGVDVLLLLFSAGALAAVVGWAGEAKRESPRGLIWVCGVAAGMIVVPDALMRIGGSQPPVPFSQRALFAFFLKVGMTLYGGGYVLIAFLRDGLVHQWHWLTEAQLLDAIAVGQFTPGPLFTTATFVGYLIGGVTGAIVGTVAIFVPSFVLIAISGPLVPLLRRSKMAGFFLDGVNVAALALMAAVTVELASAAFVDVWAIAIGMVSFLILLRWRMNAAWLIGAGAICGTILRAL